MLKAFEVVRKKMGIDDPTAPLPPGTPAPAPPVSSPAAGLGVGTGGATGGGVGSLAARRLEQSSRFPQTSEMSIEKWTEIHDPSYLLSYSNWHACIIQLRSTLHL